MSVPSPNNPALKPHGIFHGIFDVVVILKGLNGLAEVASGTTLLLLKDGTILLWVQWLTRTELLQDPHDLLATYLQHWASGFGHDAQVFAALYLLGHGFVKLTLAILLFMEKSWAFPLSIVLFGLLLVFSIHRLSVDWSWALLSFIAFDIFTIAIIVKEWRAVERLRSSKIQ